MDHSKPLAVINRDRDGGKIILQHPLGIQYVDNGFNGGVRVFGLQEQ